MIFKYDLDDIICDYYLIGESTQNEPNIKLCCSSKQLYKIVEYAMDEVVSEIEFELKENYILGYEEPNMLNYCGKYLLNMYLASLVIICNDDATSNLKEDYISNITRKHIYCQLPTPLKGSGL